MAASFHTALEQAVLRLLEEARGPVDPDTLGERLRAAGHSHSPDDLATAVLRLVTGGHAELTPDRRLTRAARPPSA
jgi:hypothetical protein